VVHVAFQLSTWSPG